MLDMLNPVGDTVALFIKNISVPVPFHPCGKVILKPVSLSTIESFVGVNIWFSNPVTRLMANSVSDSINVSFERLLWEYDTIGYGAKIKIKQEIIANDKYFSMGKLSLRCIY
jgi:hypothetical protein